MKITQERQDHIKNLFDYNDAKLRSISFNHCKIDCLKIIDEPSQKLAEEQIQKHFDKYQDEDEKDLLMTFFNKYKIK